MSRATANLPHDITLHAAIGRAGENPPDVAHAISTFTDQASSVLGITDWTAPLGPAWEGSIENRMNGALRMARDILDTPAGERGLNMTLTARHGDHHLAAIFTAAPDVGTTTPLNYVSIRIAHPDPDREIDPDTAFLLLQILAGAFRPQVAYVTSTALALYGPASQGWEPPIGYDVWIPRDTDTLNVPDPQWISITSTTNIPGTLIHVDPILTENSIATQLRTFYNANNITVIPHG